jgi:GDSL-like lipase/acylhydrolase family protein
MKYSLLALLVIVASDAAATKAAEDAVIAEKYAELVARLPPDQQAWERTLQENLGSFYLPLHKNEKVAGRSGAWDFVQDDPKLPRVLLIGDSVSRAYTLPVRQALAGKVNVHRAPENCGPTSHGLKKLDVWLGDGRWDLVYFNFGLHESNTTAEDYEHRLEQIVERLQKTGAKLIWASTTPVSPGTPNWAEGKVEELNAVAARVMQRHGVAIDDLYGAILPTLAEHQRPKDVHFHAAGNEKLGQEVARSILAALK